METTGPARGDYASMSDQQKMALAMKAHCDDIRAMVQEQLDLEAAGSKGNYPGVLLGQLRQNWAEYCSRPSGTGAVKANAAAVGDGHFVVSLGTYSSAVAAQALVLSLRAEQLPAYTESVALAGKSATRVRIGPFPLRSDAEAARLKAQQVRTDTPAAGTSPPVSAIDSAAFAPTAAGRRYAVQVSAFRIESEAIRLRNKLRAAGFMAFSGQEQSNMGMLFRVRIGPESDRSAADLERARLLERLGLSGMVVAYP